MSLEQKRMMLDDTQKMAQLSRRAGRELRQGIQEYKTLVRAGTV